MLSRPGRNGRFEEKFWLAIDAKRRNLRRLAASCPSLLLPRLNTVPVTERVIVKEAPRDL